MDNFLIHTKNSFNKIADAFDEADGSNEILQWMRRTVYEIYLSNFKEGNRLLELNAGTGIDAVLLASKGIKVFATDISDNMMRRLNEKVERYNLQNMIQTATLSFDEIHMIKDKDFDGAVSNFGGLNCINNFQSLSVSLADKIKPGGKFIASVMHSLCPWEIIYFLSKFDSVNAFRRFNKEGIEANLSEFRIKSFYFTSKEFAGQFHKYFETEKTFSLGLFTPPPYLFGIYEKSKSAVKTFMKLDNLLKGVYPFNRAGDHFIIVLRRNNTPSEKC